MLSSRQRQRIRTSEGTIGTVIPLGKPPHRPRFTLAQAMGLVVLAALICRWPGPMISAVPPLLVYLLATKLGPAPERRTWVRLGVLLTAVYAPCVFGFFSDCDHCRLTWLKLFPIVPGVGPSFGVVRLLGLGRLADGIELGLAAVAATGIIGVLTLISRRGRAWLLASSAFGFAWSSVWARALYAAVRA
jgi:hypothetical protein